jgi:hypothetical protein
VGGFKQAALNQAKKDGAAGPLILAGFRVYDRMLRAPVFNPVLPILKIQNRFELPHTNPVLAQNHLGKPTNQPTSKTHLKTTFYAKNNPLPNQPWPSKLGFLLGVWPLAGLRRPARAPRGRRRPVPPQQPNRAGQGKRTRKNLGRTSVAASHAGAKERRRLRRIGVPVGGWSWWP